MTRIANPTKRTEVGPVELVPLDRLAAAAHARRRDVRRDQDNAAEFRRPASLELGRRCVRESIEVA